MKKATRKQEIEIVREIVGMGGDWLHPDRIRHLACSASRYGIEYTRINAWLAKNTTLVAWQWHQLLHTLELGWKRYFYGCSHEDSIFCRIYCYLAARIPCTCCLWWRTVAIATTLTIASFFLGKYLP